ncbi:methyltransferase domain-containing protein [Photobacterium alginatilyticum]|uniref:Class I SAM-dependent methyltransferase n=1 Tax=Photobacterium alginatilyticum TaxID=1775171 RepID=A0ABW9YPC4_9GAMM|nr:class I SAM-dependent methyltransferase [Photobacterium alginatilyticum]
MQEEYMGYYANFDEEQRLVCQNITRIEFDTTINQLETFTQPAKKLTELGAATGRYSIYYAQKGLEVTAVELVPELVSQLEDNAAEQGVELSIHEANVTDVHFVPDSSQDIVLILGPLYHIQNESDRQAVIKEAHRILKPNGVAAFAYISRFFVAGLLAKMSSALVTPLVLGELHETGLVTSKDVDAFFRTGYFATPAEVEDLAQSAGFNIEKHVATDGFGRYIGAEINSLSESEYQAWLQHHLLVCSEPSLLGSSNHGLVIARKHG